MDDAPTQELPVVAAPWLGTRELATLIIAFGLVVAVNLIALGILIEVVRNQTARSLSENATQVLTGAFGGMIGILGSQLGYRAADRSGRRT